MPPPRCTSTHFGSSITSISLPQYSIISVLVFFLMCLIGNKVPLERAKTSETYRLCAVKTLSARMDAPSLGVFLQKTLLVYQHGWATGSRVNDKYCCLQSRTWEFAVTTQTLESVRQPYQLKTEEDSEKAKGRMWKAIGRVNKERETDLRDLSTPSDLCVYDMQVKVLITQVLKQVCRYSNVGLL